ncbi:uncharacterized protein F4807DRAFT_19122 [Annulohypoxylon truncatum]|uniref:uncharacterized protein n=1 Tax=Annulohypoxylon truncatum TaxID=327061 RepID=UPI002008E505|nr:uncharacterized protein F4807DRAFT_19122 [Annulohypoxylon truncatum]KAI1215053.1 hypothetical protein F4807DRAFT_19122 [Annulohypoxylon truncatum]
MCIRLRHTVLECWNRSSEYAMTTSFTRLGRFVHRVRRKRKAERIFFYYVLHVLHIILQCQYSLVEYLGARSQFRREGNSNEGYSRARIPNTNPNSKRPHMLPTIYNSQSQSYNHTPIKRKFAPPSFLCRLAAYYIRDSAAGSPTSRPTIRHRIGRCLLGRTRLPELDKGWFQVEEAWVGLSTWIFPP